MSQEKYLMSLSDADRLQVLQDTSHLITETKYSKPLTEEDMAEAKNAVAENCIKLSDFNEELTKIKKEYKDKMAPFVEHNATLLMEIRTKQRIVAGIIYDIADYENNKMETYNSEGEQVSSRRLKPEEKQGKVFALGQAK
jgi:hypothetical protein